MKWVAARGLAARSDLKSQRRLRSSTRLPAAGGGQKRAGGPRPLLPAIPVHADAPTLRTLPAGCSRALSSPESGPSGLSSGIIAARRSGLACLEAEAGTGPSRAPRSVPHRSLLEGGGRGPSVRNFPLPNRRPRRLQRTAASANQRAKEAGPRRPGPARAAEESRGNAVAPGNRLARRRAAGRGAD